MDYSKEFKLALYSLDGVGVKRFFQTLKILTKYEISETDFWVNKQQIWQKLPFNKKIENSIYKFKKEHDIYSYFAKILAKNIRVVFSTDGEYPSLLKELEFHPPLIFIKGKKLSTQKSLAVVGTRQITPYGKQVIEWLLPDLATRLTIVSGFMYGVDIYAQQLALKNGGNTVGVLGFGFDHMYPREHQKIMASFLAKGASFISPFAPHVCPRPGNFPARNTLVAAMSTGLCVIEAAQRSGSLLTASIAADLGREVWAVPGSIFSQFSAGVQELLKQGASLVREPADILLVLDQDNQNKNESKKGLLAQFNLDKKELIVLELLQVKKASFEELLAKTYFLLPELQNILFKLQMKNLVEEQGVWWFSRI